MNAPRQFVFGYGSLAARREGCRVATLSGHRRSWGVAMDNSVDVPGYKHFRLRRDASRPAIFVAFLDVEPDPRSTVTGLCIPVDERRLRELDRRERNYDRVDVSAAIDAAPGLVWTYRGSVDGRARLLRGIEHGCAAVSRDYLEDVLGALNEIAPSAEAASVKHLIDESGLSLLDLERVDGA